MSSIVRPEASRLVRTMAPPRLTTSLLLTFLLVFVSMASKDVLGTIGVVFVVHGQGWLGGVFDGIADIAAVLSVGVEGVVTVKNRLTWPTFVGFAVLFSASTIGTALGVVVQAAMVGGAR